MTSTQTAEDARALTRQRREKRTDAVIELPFNERVTVECSECGSSQTVAIYAPPDAPPSFTDCWNRDCDAYLKLQSDGAESNSSSQVEQIGLDRYAAAGGAES